MVERREALAEVVEEVPGAAEEVGLEDPDQLFSGVRRPRCGNGAVDFTGVVGVVVDDGQRGGVQPHFEPPGDAGEIA